MLGHIYFFVDIDKPPLLQQLLVYQKVIIRYEYQLFPLSNFPRAAILNFYDLIWLHYRKEATFFLYVSIMATVWRHKNSKWECAGNSKAKIGSTFKLFPELLT